MNKAPDFGDIVSFDPNYKLCKLRQQPMDVLKEIEDMENPAFIYNKHESPPEDTGNWLVIDVRDLFNRFGRRRRICKVSNIVTSSSGWVFDKALIVVLALEK